MWGPDGHLRVLTGSELSQKESAVNTGALSPARPGWESLNAEGSGGLGHFEPKCARCETSERKEEAPITFLQGKQIFLLFKGGLCVVCKPFLQLK